MRHSSENLDPEAGSLVAMHSATFPATLKLRGADRARYFAPVVFFGFLAALCLALIAISPFLVGIRDAVAISAPGVFGLISTGAAGALILRTQLRWLRYSCIPLHADRCAAAAAVRQVIADAGWRVTRQSVNGLEARTPGSLFAEGELVSVQFRDHEVLVASICDPQIGFSLVGNQRCLQHCDRIRQAVLTC